MPALVVIHGVRRGDFFNLQHNAELVIGRDASLLASLKGDASVSRRHVEFIRHDDDQCFAIDLGSRNGVRINDAKIDHSQEISDGDIIQVGHTLLVFVNKELDDASPVDTFLKACERLYGEYLEKMREYDQKKTQLASHDNSETLNFGVTTKYR